MRGEVCHFHHGLLGLGAVRKVTATGVRRVVAWADKAAEAYGVNPRILIGLYVFSVIPFYVGIFMILSGSGVALLSLRGLFEFSYDDLDFGSRTAVAGLLLNRFAWALPYLYIEFFGRRLKWYLHVAVWVWILSATASIFW